MKPFDKISTNAFLEAIVKCLSYVFMVPFLIFFQCPEKGEHNNIAHTLYYHLQKGLWSTEYCYFYTKLLQKMHLSIIDGHNCTESFVVHGHGDCGDVSFLEELLFVGIAGDVDIGHRTERAENFPNLFFRYVLSQIGDGNKNLSILIILT